MKTGPMLFVAFGGMMLGAAGTLAVQTGLMHYEVSLDIRPRASATIPPPALSSSAGDPYHVGPTVQHWESMPPQHDNLPLVMPPLDDQQIAEIVSVREQIGHPVSQRLGDIAGSSADCLAGPSFADHLRTAAGVGGHSVPSPAGEVCPACPAEESSIARQNEAQQR